MRTWGNDYATAAVEAALLAYPTIDAKNLDVYDSSFYVDDALDNGGSASASVPGSLKLVLDYRPIRTTLSITLNASPASSILEWGSTPSASGQVAVNFTTGELQFHGDDETASVVATYKHYGTVVDANAYNRLQAAVSTTQSNLTSLEVDFLAHDHSFGEITGNVADGQLSSNVPLKNAANTFSARQTFSGGGIAIGGADSGFTLLPSSATSVVVATTAITSSTDMVWVGYSGYHASITGAPFVTGVTSGVGFTIRVPAALSVDINILWKIIHT